MRSHHPTWCFSLNLSWPQRKVGWIRSMWDLNPSPGRNTRGSWLFDFVECSFLLLHFVIPQTLASGLRTGGTDWETHMARLWMIWAFITSTWQDEAVQWLISDPCLFVHIHANFLQIGPSWWGPQQHPVQRLQQRGKSCLEQENCAPCHTELFHFPRGVRGETGVMWKLLFFHQLLLQTARVGSLKQEFLVTNTQQSHLEIFTHQLPKRSKEHVGYTQKR